jgi:hypothetical protein
VGEVVSAAIRDFLRGRASMNRAFDASGASDIVAAVLQSRMPREGVTPDGWQYFVHGVGYTVTSPDGAEVHIDAGREGDVISAYDVRNYLQSVNVLPLPEISAIRSMLDRLVDDGLLMVRENRYSMR